MRIPSVTIGSILCLGALLAMAGCTTPQAASPSPSPAVAVAVGLPSGSGSAPSGQTNAANQFEASPPNSDKAAANGSLVQPAGMTEGKKEAADDQAKKTFDSYTSQKPVLMGIALAEGKDKVETLHGQPKNQYVMEDEAGSITVYDYEGFSVGFNAKNEVEFIDVTSPDIDPGLNGFKLGQTPDEAVQALGKADSSTDYVLSFKTKTTVLKLDVDPKTKTVQSIKLFARSE